MDKVSREKILFSWFKILNFALLGNFWYNTGDRYEGEWKDGKTHGQGNKKWFLEWYFDSNIAQWCNRQGILQ